MPFPATRLRRLRQTGVLRDLVRETSLEARHLVLPMFVTHEAGRTPIGAMPGIDRLSIDAAVEELLAAGALALEREEHAFTRLVRGLVPRWLLVVEKTLLAALLAFAVGLASSPSWRPSKASTGAGRRCGWSRWPPAASPSAPWAWRSAA